MELAYLSKLPGIGGVMKSCPEDFLVEEITAGGEILELDKTFERAGEEGDFTYFVLQKRNWNTLQALKEVGRKLHCGLKRFGYAGVKDRNAVTTQLASAFKIEPVTLRDIHIKDIKINAAWKAKEKMRIGDLTGNRFTISVREVTPDAEERVRDIHASSKGLVPNYFGEQRFGSIRKNTHLVGKAIISGNFKEAVLGYLTYIDEGEETEGKEARRQLAAEGDFKRALEYFPSYLGYELTLLNYLSSYPNDYVNAMRKLPRGLSLMFVHAYQSYLFNKALSKRISERDSSVIAGDLVCRMNSFGFPDVTNAERVDDVAEAEKRIEKGELFLTSEVVGSETKEIGDYERQIMEEEGIKKENFLIHSFPEISSRGSKRCMFIPLKDFKFNYYEGIGKFAFSLQGGAYATSVMREFVDRCK
ncbi:MAG: tRNA pseudouridine(13) synthase TruD [Candidatus Micrarchaeota archaeon]|nr:tRNA pseudouridine(13) synthase TruD [Candidatus Micrarchaeota archaeon]